MSTTVIDADGEVWDSFSPLLRSKLRCPNAGGKLADLALGSGFVVLRSRGARSIEVGFQPSLVKPIALSTAAQWLSDRDCDRIVIKSRRGSQRTPFIGDAAEAIPYLVRLATAAQSTRKHEFLSQRHALDAVARDAAFARLQAAWRAARDVKTRGLVEAVTQASCGRYLEVVPRDGASRLVMDAVGNGYSLYGRGWKSVAVGGRFEDMPDFEYAQWAAQGYRDAFRAGQPIFEDITAAVRLPRSGSFLLKYRRAILPIGGGEQPALLLGATLNQSVTRLALGAGNKFGDVLQ
jgi:hypothetical protein